MLMKRKVLNLNVAGPFLISGVRKSDLAARTGLHRLRKKGLAAALRRHRLLKSLELWRGLTHRY